MSHGKRIRLRCFCKHVLHETYLLSLNLKNYVKFEKDILSIFAELLSIRGILVFLFIMNKPTDKNQDAEMFC